MHTTTVAISGKRTSKSNFGFQKQKVQFSIRSFLVSERFSGRAFGELSPLSGKSVTCRRPTPRYYGRPPLPVAWSHRRHGDDVINDDYDGGGDAGGDGGGDGAGIAHQFGDEGCAPTSSCGGRELVFETLGAAHPGFGANCVYPVREGRDEAEVFADVLFADPPNGDLAAR